MPGDLPVSFSPLALVLLGEMLFLFALLHSIYQRRSPTSMIAWLLAISLLPYLAVPLYFLVGFRKRKSIYNKSKLSLSDSVAGTVPETNPIATILHNTGIPRATRDNRVELYFNGVDAYRALLDEIRNATQSIYISTYVFRSDAVTRELLAALTEKARQGVTVKLLLDSLGSFQLYFYQSPLKALRHAGGAVEFFMPLLRMPLRNYINLRNHRKVYLFDNRLVITGGMNLSRKYMGPTPDGKRWNDLLFLAEGSAAAHYYRIFAADWAYATEEALPTDVSAVHGGGNTYLQVVPSGPDVEGDPLFEALLSAIYAAKKRIWIVTPYFVPDMSIMYALIIAQHKNVDVKLITPRQSDHLVADLCRSSFMRELEEQTVHVALYEGQMLHAKAILFDDFGAMLGSVNIDNRSLFLNYEVASFAYSPEVIQNLEAWMLDILGNSGRIIAPVGRLRRLGENLMRTLAPEL